MKRHPLLALAAIALLVFMGAVAGPKKTSLLLLDWSAKATGEPPPVAILIELGLKDEQPTRWAGRAVVTGAKVVHREGYRFRDGDRLTEPDAWQASSHRPLRLPPRNPALARTEGIATVGVVLHLAGVEANAALTIEPAGGGRAKANVPLAEVLAGSPRPVWDGAAVVRRISAATALVTAKTEDDFPAAAYGPDGTLWLAYVSYTLKDESRRIEQQPLKEQPADFKAFDTPEFGDQLFVKYCRGGKWSEPIAVTRPKEDLARCAVGVEANGNAWVVYSAHRAGRFDLYARPISKNYHPQKAEGEPRPGPEQRLTRDGAGNVSPVMCTDQAGQLQVTYQRWAEDGKAGFGLLSCRAGEWAGALNLPALKNATYFFGGPGNYWNPAIAAGPRGELAHAYDFFNQGDYDVGVHLVTANSARNLNVATTNRFEARPSLAYDPQGRLWIAYEEGPENWGKDYGALDAEDGNPLYNARSVRVVCLVGDKLFKPVAELPTSTSKSHQPDERTPRYAYPKIGIDGKGRVWLTYREKFGTRYSTHPGSYWLTFARRLDGAKWSAPIELHHSDGLLDDRPVLLPHQAGGLVVIHNTDGRHTTPEAIDNQIYASVVDLPGEPVEPKLVEHQAGTKNTKRGDEERAAVERIRAYRVEGNGTKYRLLRGEFHRHTEISWDGGPDGSLEDMFRYAIDAAALDWIGNTDHDNGAGREYPWWLTQKWTDAYHVPGFFTPMFAYERSVAYPHGHRNCIFARRGIRTLPRLEEADPARRVGGVHADDTKMLYRYLTELGGICASHTSATGMGTDWRDNDPQVEPVVEIYQGDRMSYEYQGAPRAGYDPASGKQPAQIGGWRPAGFIDNAFARGYRLGFQSSSDHWSTHISFCIALAEKPERESILEALRKRRCYAATDDIILDVRSSEHLMGEEFKTAAAPALQIKVIGTKPLARVDVLRDSKVVATLAPMGREFQGAWTDPAAAAGVHYYYVRVEQKDGELAWGSPFWINFAP